MLRDKRERKYFFMRIILPTFLAFCLFTLSIFAIIIPTFESNMMERKREMTRELTNSAWSILDDFHEKEISGELTRELAQDQAKNTVKNLRYGIENKDYFWITDMHPNMMMHPYREELNGTDLSNYQDPKGKKLFVDFVKLVKKDSEGYDDYMWQWMDDSTKIVPKLSFVKEFKPWGWIIGTGIYIEDVRTEISNLTSDLIYISLGILFVLGLLLFFVTQQSLKIENDRQTAQDELEESEAKYRALVEAATEGLVMMLDGEFVYANKTMMKLLSITNDNLSKDELKNILCNTEEETSGRKYFSDLLSGKTPEQQYEAKISDKDSNIIDVLLVASPITFGEKSGYTIIVKDISTHKQITEELGESEEKYKLLTNNIRIGVFRTTAGRRANIIELNPSAIELLGYSNKQELLEKNILDLFYNENDRNNFLYELTNKTSVKNFVTTIVRKNRTTIKLSLSAVLVKDKHGNELFCDGIIEDVTERLKLEEDRENLIADLQASIHFLNEPINRFIKNFISCEMSTSIKEAASMMTKKKYSAIIITTQEGKHIGIVTDSNLRSRAVANEIDLSTPVYQVMTSPIITINEHALVFEAFLKMFEMSTRHLAVVNSDGKTISLISSEELLQVQRHSSTFLLKEIEIGSTSDIPSIKMRLPIIVKALVDSGAKSKNITKTITSVADSIATKYIESAIKVLGPPPVNFAYLALGSQGREEQTLFTDQDSAIIIDDSETKITREMFDYFLKLAKNVTINLQGCGYELCKGESMASNPKWCQPLSEWKKYYSSWIYNSNPQDLLELSIFFDFRKLYGDDSLVDELRKFLFQTASDQSGFFQHLTRNCLEHKPPVSIMGNIVLESKGEHPETFNIKNAIMPLTDFGRIYAIKNAIAETNTLERFRKLFDRDILQKNSYEELLLSYNFLMQLRIKHQVRSSELNLSPNNSISPSELTQIEIKTLKNIFSQITAIQKRLGAEFTGESL